LVPFQRKVDEVAVPDARAPLLATLIHFVDVPVVDSTCPSVPVALNESRIFNTAKVVTVAEVIVASDKLAVPELTVRLDIVVVAAEVVAKIVLPETVRLVKIEVTAFKRVANRLVDVALVIVALVIFAPIIVPLGSANEPEA
jgi:hypothetical protein